jgi:hypothetical protein
MSFPIKKKKHHFFICNLAFQLSHSYISVIHDAPWAAEHDSGSQHKQLGLPVSMLDHPAFGSL